MTDIIDGNVVLLTHLLADVPLQALVADRIYVPNLPENVTLPAVSMETRGGESTPYIPGWRAHSVQITTWAKGSQGYIDARKVYRAIYNCLQGIQNQDVVIGLNTYQILSASEETIGQDVQDPEVLGYYSVLSFWEILIRAEL